MAGVVCNNGESVALQLLANKIATPENLVLKLFTNDVTPGESDTIGTYTEASFTGYSAITLTGASWTATPGDPTTLAYAQQTFASSADQTAQTIYGYFLIRVTTGDLIASERFTNAPFTIENDGDTLKITPTLKAS